MVILAHSRQAEAKPLAVHGKFTKWLVSRLDSYAQIEKSCALDFVMLSGSSTQVQDAMSRSRQYCHS